MPKNKNLPEPVEARIPGKTKPMMQVIGEVSIYAGYNVTENIENVKRKFFVLEDLYEKTHWIRTPLKHYRDELYSRDGRGTIISCPTCGGHFDLVEVAVTWRLMGRETSFHGCSCGIVRDSTNYWKLDSQKYTGLENIPRGVSNVSRYTNYGHKQMVNFHHFVFTYYNYEEMLLNGPLPRCNVCGSLGVGVFRSEGKYDGVCWYCIHIIMKKNIKQMIQLFNGRRDPGSPLFGIARDIILQIGEYL